MDVASVWLFWITNLVSQNTFMVTVAQQLGPSQVSFPSALEQKPGLRVA
jgi:hypothetical protein